MEKTDERIEMREDDTFVYGNNLKSNMWVGEEIVTSVAISVRIDIFSRIELISSNVLSSRVANYKNDIQ